MQEIGKTNSRRQNTVGNSNQNLSYYPQKDQLNMNCGGSRAEDMEKIINISLSSNSQVGSNTKTGNQLPNQPCQTTINLYINDPHVLQKNWEKYRRAPPRRKMRNEIVLGKSIPDHTLMKNLLGDLGVKKYSSAPNMTNKITNICKGSLRGEYNTSQGSFTNSTEVTSQEDLYRTPGTTFLYVNERKSGGDFMKNSIQRINEEEEDRAVVENENCPVHCSDNTVVRLQEDSTAKDAEKTTLKDPLKRFRRKPFRHNQINKNPPILYRDTIALKPNQNERMEQPRRTQPSFQFRTRMVKDILESHPEFMHTYQTGLMRNHKSLFDSLRRKNFSDVLEDDKTRATDDPLPMIKKGRTIDPLDVEQSKLILCGKNQRPICSVESHGSYEEYRRKLVKAPNGSLCCGNSDLGEDQEDTWSRAETRNIITSEFVKDKVKKFDKLLGKVNNASDETPKTTEICDRNFRNQYPLTYPGQEILSHHLLNEEPVSFPKETKNAMTRLLSENAKMYLKNENKDGNVDNRPYASLRRIRDFTVNKKKFFGYFKCWREQYKNKWK